MSSNESTCAPDADPDRRRSSTSSGYAKPPLHPPSSQHQQHQLHFAAAVAANSRAKNAAQPKMRNMSESSCLSIERVVLSNSTESSSNRRRESVSNSSTNNHPNRRERHASYKQQQQQQRSSTSSSSSSLASTSTCAASTGPLLTAGNNQLLVTFVMVLVTSIVVNSVYFRLYHSHSHSSSASHPNQQRVPAAATPAVGSANSRLPFSSHLDNEKFELIKAHVVFPTLNDHSSSHTRSSSGESDGADANTMEESVEQQLDARAMSSRHELLVTTVDTSPLKSSKRKDAEMALRVAMSLLSERKYEKASRVYKYALSLDPDNTDALTGYGEYLELHKHDVRRAEHFYTRALYFQPKHDRAALNLRRALPLVNKLDGQMLDELDALLERFYAIPATSGALKRAKREAYFMHIYHSNAIEGNSLNLQQTRFIVENRVAVNGKSMLEHQEVLGLDAAMRYMNETLLYRPIGYLTLNDILELHRRVLGYCDPFESGKLRRHQVYVGHFVPPNARHVRALMNEFVEWLNANQLIGDAHPVQIAALVHYKFVYIHPFYDGNGRTARLLMNLILMKSGYPPIIIRKQERLEYYEYLEMANQGDVKPFMRFIASCTRLTLEEYIKVCDDAYSLDHDSSATGRVGIATRLLTETSSANAPSMALDDYEEDIEDEEEDSDGSELTITTIDKTSESNSPNVISTNQRKKTLNNPDLTITNEQTFDDAHL